MPPPEAQRLSARMHKEVPVSANNALLDVLKRPSSDLSQQDDSDPDTDYRDTRRPTNTHSSTVQTLVVLLLSFLTNFIIVNGAVAYDTVVCHAPRHAAPAPRACVES